MLTSKWLLESLQEITIAGNVIFHMRSLKIVIMLKVAKINVMVVIQNMQYIKLVLVKIVGMLHAILYSNS